jgi:hypothetical protein
MKFKIDKAKFWSEEAKEPAHKGSIKPVKKPAKKKPAKKK